jgi:hypothetical protein
MLSLGNTKLKFETDFKILGSNLEYVILQDTSTLKVSITRFVDEKEKYSFFTDQQMDSAQLNCAQLLLLGRSNSNLNTEIRLFNLGSSSVDLIAQKTLNSISVISCKLSEDAIYIAANYLNLDREVEDKNSEIKGKIDEIANSGDQDKAPYFSFAKKYSFDFKTETLLWTSKIYPDDLLLFGSFSSLSEFCFIDNGFIFYFLENDKIKTITYPTETDFRRKVVSVVYSMAIKSIGLKNGHWVFSGPQNEPNKLKLGEILRINEISHQLEVHKLLNDIVGEISLYEDPEQPDYYNIEIISENRKQIFKFSTPNSIIFLKILVDD